jgi:iron complex transport system substrate-binding protein
VLALLAVLVATALLSRSHTLVADEAQPVQLRDAAGRLVELKAPASRIVALAPHIVENLYAIGAGATLLAAVEYSDYPPAAAGLPRVGGIAGISLEGIVALQPDLVIAWESGTDPALLSALGNLGVPYYVDEIRSLVELAHSISNLGALTAHEQQAGQAVGGIEAMLAASAVESEDEAPTVFLQVWDEPLQSVGRDHLLTEVIERCGGRSVTADLPGLAPQVNLEAVLAADPDVIIVASADQGRHWQRFPQLQAVAGERVEVIHPDYLQRPTLRLMQGMQQLCTVLGADA